MTGDVMTGRVFFDDVPEQISAEMIGDGRLFAPMFHYVTSAMVRELSTMAAAEELRHGPDANGAASDELSAAISRATCIVQALTFVRRRKTPARCLPRRNAQNLLRMINAGQPVHIELNAQSTAWTYGTASSAGLAILALLEAHWAKGASSPAAFLHCYQHHDGDWGGEALYDLRFTVAWLRAAKPDDLTLRALRGLDGPHELPGPADQRRIPARMLAEVWGAPVAFEGERTAGLCYTMPGSKRRTRAWLDHETAR